MTTLDEAITGISLDGAPNGTAATGRDGEPDLEGLSPAALRRMGPAELEGLAAAIRRFLVGAVATTGGHLGSNLGAVELSIALHRVFDSPADPIVWDTGHQAYVHKLLTGRAEGFATLRKAGGLSGYPSRRESAHDLVENSHASAALSYADGLARARDLSGATHQVVAVVGDGALTGGLAYEALNNIGTAGRRVVVVLNDNGRSYAPTISRLTTACRTAGAASTGVPGTAGFFGALGLDYLGPVDGHDLGALESALRSAATSERPVVVHVHTVKGRGYPPPSSTPRSACTTWRRSTRRAAGPTWPRAACRATPRRSARPWWPRRRCAPTSWPSPQR